MLFWKTENRIEPKRDFYSKIKEYYFRISDNQIPMELLNEIISKVTDRIYSDYKRFWKQYLKSRKRYSTLKMDDIENPYIHFLLTDFLKTKDVVDYRNFSKILLKMNDEEFDEYLEYKNWYETK
ncbi:hypothetical protein ATE84_2493 [Aquimarina sp. MAR_2010_214]|uniref:hypothetical protein n=1 Tax=Aquimarina sp. MAR_2010_214 TaxID=1250026 RepID=UPI000C70919E|nr:hypothetical protein [Aquimarina sp. MAR_2010_214]PKV50436.1 hypothetical protein ATE84_2493 [Aquimarina sp. MAR_2010_214]